MDRLSFGFSLLLIVSVTTIISGSVIKAKNPNGEEVGALLKRSPHQSNPDKKTDAQAKLLGQNGLKDQDSETLKIEPGSLSPGTITLASLEKQLQSPSDKDIGIATGIENQSGYGWTAVSSYLAIGIKKREVTLPYDVPNGESVMFTIPPQQQSVAGVVVYYLEDIKLSVAMMYAVSVIDNVNSWNVKMYKGNPDATLEMATNMGYCSNVADDQWHEGSHEFVKYSVFMSTSRQAIFKIQIFKS